MKYVVLCENGFLDGNVLDRRIAPGEELEVNELTYKKLIQSDPDGWTLLRKEHPIPSVPDLNGMTYDEAVEVVESASLQDLDELEEMELAGKDRVTVLNAISERREELSG